jgi:phosphoribosylformimino-5-aminoimidazole carboxamide ribotide isomerase
MGCESQKIWSPTADVAALRNAGATRVIVGTIAARDPALVRRLAAAHPNTLIVALDTRSGHIAVDGWQTTTRMEPAAVLAGLMNAPLGALIHTDIARDGTLAGPELASLEALCHISPWLVLAAGGIATLDDLRALGEIPRLHGAIVGRALLEGTLALPLRGDPS